MLSIWSTQTLLECEDRVRLFQEITRIKCDIDLEVSLEELEPSQASVDELEPICDEMSFGKHVRERLTVIAQASPA